MLGVQPILTALSYLVLGLPLLIVNLLSFHASAGSIPLVLCLETFLETSSPGAFLL